MQPPTLSSFFSLFLFSHATPLISLCIFALNTSARRTNKDSINASNKEVYTHAQERERERERESESEQGARKRALIMVGVLAWLNCLLFPLLESSEFICTGYNGRALFHIRGHTSANFPKHQFSVTTCYENTTRYSMAMFGWLFTKYF